MHRLLLYACLLRCLPAALAQPAQIVDFCHSMWSPCGDQEGSIAYAHTIGDSLMTEIELQENAAFFFDFIIAENPGYSLADYARMYAPIYEESYQRSSKIHETELRCCLVPLVVDSTQAGLYAYSGYFITGMSISPSGLWSYGGNTLVYLSPTEAFVISPFVNLCQQEHYKQVLATFAQRVPGGIHLPCLEKFLPYKMPKEYFTLMGLSLE